MLPRHRRLRSHHEYRRVYKGGKTLNLAFFKLKTHPHLENGKESRIGIVFSNKIVKDAVARNRKKRQLRAIFKELAPFLKSGYDIVVIATPKSSNATYREMHEDVVAGLTKIQFLKNKTT